MFERMRMGLASRLMPSVPAPQIQRREATPEDIGRAIVSGSRSSTGSASERSRKELLDAYNTMPWLRAVVHKVAHSTAMVPWRLLVMRDSRGKAQAMRKLQRTGDHATRQRIMQDLVRRKEAEFEEIDDHPLLNLLNTGSDVLPGPTSSQVVQMHMDLTGEAFEVKERNTRVNNERTGSGVVQQLLPIPPSWVVGLPSPAYPFFEIQFGNSGTTTPIRQEDVVMYRDPNPLSPYRRGSGTAGSLVDELQSNRAAMQTIRTRLENNSVPPFLAMPEDPADGQGGPTREQLSRIKEEWERRLAGPDKGGFVHFLRRRFKFEKLGNTFEELSLVPLLDQQRNTIIQVYGIPPEVIGVLSDSNRATISAAETLFAKHVLLPRLEQRRATLQRSLVTDFDDRLILDYESPVPADAEAEREVMSNHAWAFTADEIRARGGEAPLEDEVAGGSHAVPSNTFIEPSLSGAPAGPDGDDDGGNDGGGEAATPVPVTTAPDAYLITGDKVRALTETERTKVAPINQSGTGPYWLILEAEGRRRTRKLDTTDREHAVKVARRLLVKAPKGALSAILARQAAKNERGVLLIASEVVEQSVPPVMKQTQGEILEVVDDIDEQVLVDNTMPSFRDGVEAAGQQRLEELGLQVNFDLDDPKVIAFLAEQSSGQIKGINETTKARVRAALAEGMDNGEGVNQLARRVRGTFAEAAGRRSVVISRTESVRALNRGALSATEQAGMEGKQWLSTRDMATRESHAPFTGMDGQIRRVNSNFNSPITGAAGQHPGAMGLPEEDVNCLVDPETLIHTERGLKPVRDIEIGDRVLTHQGRYRRVLRLAPVRDYDGQVVTICCTDRTVRITPNHRILTDRGWDTAFAIAYMKSPVSGIVANEQGKLLWGRIISVDVTKGGGSYQLYNFAVEEDESYVANGIVLKNCRCTTLAVPRVGDDDLQDVSGDDIRWPPWADTEDKRAQIWKAAERIRKPIEEQLRRAFRRGFANQEKLVLDSLQSLED